LLFAKGLSWSAGHASIKPVYYSDIWKDEARKGVLFVLVVSLQIIGEEGPAMLIIMAVGTEVFPVAAILGIIEMVTVPVVDSKKVQIVLGKLATAFGADPPVKLQRTLPVVSGRRFLPLHPPHQFVQFLLASRRDWSWSAWFE
jgi:hypothetical protein